MIHARNPLQAASPAEGIPLEALGFDAFETALVPVLRHFLTALASPDSQGWRLAYGIAAERWGPGDGPQIAHRLFGMVEAMQACRPTRFRFGNPLCAQCRGLLTPDEVAFVTLLHHMRRDRTDAARPALADLSGGVMDVALIRAGLSFAARFPAMAGAAQQAGTRHLH
ncbi:MAG: hypothetical protein A2092_17620 [Rhodobacteraceae bacterium GWE1_64_9]|nr:MAG: hypothetical protein A2092_17620 [Rhodobacteraceae bacterium GWE1_64_9]OHC50652.1 MAG: hypothetical protein A2X69_09060 [Rhodobacteraceae bacterium GWF1_65_7]HBU15067.1 hypothetical protein [Gemmobacter sp.]